MSVILMSLVMLGLGLKMLFDPKSNFIGHSCAFEDSQKNNNEACKTCGLKDLIDCPDANANIL
jgi:hypothetical protein